MSKQIKATQRETEIIKEKKIQPKKSLLYPERWQKITYLFKQEQDTTKKGSFKAPK